MHAIREVEYLVPASATSDISVTSELSTRGVDHYQLVVEVLVVAEQLIVKLPRKTVAVVVVVTVAVVDDASQQIQYAIQPEVHFKI